MLSLGKTLAAWLTPDFEDAFKREVEQLGVEELPLQQGLSQSSYASEPVYYDPLTCIKCTETLYLSTLGCMSIHSILPPVLRTDFVRP